jgi:hypothetical protein
MRLACWLPMHCPSSQLHFTPGVRAATVQSNLPEGLRHRSSNYLSTAKRVFVAYQIEEEAPRGIGTVTRTMRTFTQFLDEV